MLDSFDLSSHKKIGQKLTNHARNTLLQAINVAKIKRCSQIENIHLLYSIYLEKGSMGATILRDLGLTQKSFTHVLKPAPATIPASSPVLSKELKKVLAKAFSIAKDLRYSYVGTEHLVWSILDSGSSSVKKLIARFKKKTKSLSSSAQAPKSPASLDMPSLKDFLSIISEMDILSGFISSPVPSKSEINMQTKTTAYLDKYCLNLNRETMNRNEIIIGREREIERIINILGRKNKNNPLLIGSPGVGKTALIIKLARLISEAEIPPFLLGKTIMSLDVAALIAGTSFRGEFELRLKEIIKEISGRQDIILFIDEIHNIVGAGNISGSLDLANIIKPALSRGEIRLIGATTYKEYKQHLEKDAALERRFQTVSIKEPTPAETKRILFGLRKDYENFHNVSISDEIIDLSVDLSCRYIQERFLPDKALDVLDETAAAIKTREKGPENLKTFRKLETRKELIAEEKEKNITLENYEKAMELRQKEREIEAEIKLLGNQKTESNAPVLVKITAADVMATVAKISGVSGEKIARTKSRKIKNISKILSAKVIGQAEVIENISYVLMRSQLGIGNPERPLGSFLFLGPTGVGKTLTAKVLAREFFGSEKNLIRFDMSEFMERHSVSALIGSPAGYVGYGEGGRLTEKVRRNPYAVVLFDEVEKAHHEVFNILLQIMEEGILTDAQGLEVSFKNTVVILTTNIGMEEFNEISPTPLGFRSGQNKLKIGNNIELTKEKALRELETRIRPEILNRLDQILVFRLLAKKDMVKIARLEIGKLAERMAKQKICLLVKRNVPEFIAQKSQAKNQGARLIRKNISEMIENKIAQMMVEEKIKNNKIVVSVGKGKLKFT